MSHPSSLRRGADDADVMEGCRTHCGGNSVVVLQYQGNFHRIFRYFSRLECIVEVVCVVNADEKRR